MNKADERGRAKIPADGGGKGRQRIGGGEGRQEEGMAGEWNGRRKERQEEGPTGGRIDRRKERQKEGMAEGRKAGGRNGGGG